MKQNNTQRYRNWSRRPFGWLKVARALNHTCEQTDLSCDCLSSRETKYAIIIVIITFKLSSEHLSFKQTIFDQKMQFARAWLLFYMISLSANPQLLSAKRNFFLSILWMFSIFGPFVSFWRSFAISQAQDWEKKRSKGLLPLNKVLPRRTNGLCFGLSCPGNTPRLTQQSLCTLLFKAWVNDPALDLFETVNLWVCWRSNY